MSLEPGQRLGHYEIVEPIGKGVQGEVFRAKDGTLGRDVTIKVLPGAFGVVLYEMLTGRRLFAGEDLTETLASVIKDQPDLSGVPREVRRLLARCLERDPKRRLRGIGDA